MSTTTTNYSLVKPALTDVPDITVLNGNFDTIDAELKKKYDADNKPTKSDVGLGSVPNVSTNNQTPTYTEASTLTKLSSGEKLSVAFGKIAKAISDLISHIGNKSNPHGVTASQAGALPISGGMVEGALQVRQANNGYGHLFKNNSDTADYGTYLRDLSADQKSLTLILNAANDYFKINGLDGVMRDVLHSGNISQHALPITGGDINGKLKVSGTNDYDQITLSTKDGYTRLLCAGSDRIRLEARTTTDSNNRRLLDLFTDKNGTLLKQALRLIETKSGTGKEYNIFGEHNKPSGTYTGNGSTTSRTISVGGIGLLLYIHSGSAHAIIGYNGGFRWNTSGAYTAIPSSAAHFRNGVLTITSADLGVNYNATTYTYQLL